MKSPYPTPESSQTMMWTPSPKASVTDWPCPDTDPLTSDEASFVPTPSPFDPFTTDTATTTPVSSVKRLTERFEAILPKPATPHTTRTPSRSSAPPAPVKLPRHAYVPAPAPTVPVESAPQDEPLSWTPAPFLGEPSLYHPLAQTPVTPHIPASRGVPPPPPPPPPPPAWFQPIQAPSSVSSVAVPDEPPQFRQLEMISAPEEAQYYQHATTTESVVDSVAEDSQTGDADSPNDDFAPAESTFFTETFGSVFDRIPDSSTTSGVSQMMNSLWKKDRVGLANESFQTELQQTHGDETDRKACVSPSSKSVGFSEASPKIHYVASSGTSLRSLDSKNRQSRRNVTKKGSVWAQGSVFVQEMYEQVLKTTTATGEIDDSMPPSVEKLLSLFSCDRGTVNHDSSSKSTTPTVPHSISKEDSNTEASFTDLINEKPTPAAKTAPIDWPQDFGFASGLSEVMRKNSHEDTPYDESMTPRKNNTTELLDLDWAVPPPANRDFEHHDHFSARSDPFVPRAIAARRTSSASVKTKDPFWKNLEDPCDSPTDVVSGEINRKDRNVVRANLATKFSPPPPLPRNETLSAFGIVESFSVRNSSEETYPDPSFALDDFADEEDCLFVIPPQLTNSRSLPHVRRNHVHLLEQEDDPFTRHSNLHLLEQEDADDETLSSGPSFSPAFVDAQFSF